jgi:DNA-binding XRE family transcriptional regulator
MEGRRDSNSSAAATTTTGLFCVVAHRSLLSRPSGDLYYSLWNYSLYRNSIGLRMQPRRSRRTAPASAEALFGRALRDLRKERGLSQETLAFESGYHPTYIGQLERGKKSPSLRTIMRLAGVLQLPASEILKRVEAGSPADS